MSESAVYRNALALDTTLGEYRLESVLGAGGFGITYLARDTHLDKPVAIKEYLPGDMAVRALDGSVVPVSSDHGNDYKWGLERFILEARTLARFSHPHIVRVNRYFESNGTGYMVMDYEEGESLAQMLKRMPQPPEAELRRILMPLLDGLAAVHAAKFLHRDIKPNNIFIRSGGSPVLLDFGAARATGGSAVMTSVLTPGYAPLEQYSAEGRQGPWSDIYALGGVLFRAVTGRNPPDAVSRLQNDSVAESLVAMRGQYSEPLLNAIKWALQIRPEIRPQSVAEWKAAFEAQAQMPAAVVPSRATQSPAAVPNTRPPAKRPPRERSDAAANWRSLGLGVLLLLALLVGFEIYRRQPPPSPPAPPAVARPPAPAVPDAARPAPAPEAPVPAPDLRPPPPDALPSRELAPEADPRERPSRPPLLPDHAPERMSERMPQGVQEEFRGADRDRDGYLSRDEVQGRFPFIQREFGRVDFDGDGRISLDEFGALRRRQAEGFPKPKP